MAQSEMYDPAPDVDLPQLVYTVKPELTPEAVQNRISGSVRLALIVNASGAVQEAKVLSPLGFGLDQRALDSVRQWRFRPGRRAGRPVAVRLTLSLRFTWQDES
jgi:protein TonB